MAVRMFNARPATDVAALLPLRAEVLDGDLQELLDRLTPTLFDGCPMVHLMRLQVIRDLRLSAGKQGRRGRGKAGREHAGTGAGALASRYLLLAGDVDGSLEDFLDCLYYSRRAALNELLTCCYGYDPTLTVVAFRRYVRRCAFRSRLVVPAFDATRPELELARDARQALAEFVSGHGDVTDEQLQGDWARLAADLPVSAPSPLPRWKPGWRW